MKEYSTKKIVLITGIGEYPILVYNYLTEQNLKIDRLIVEKPVNKRIFLGRRAKKLGIWVVLGQILNYVFIVTLLKLTSKKRVREIKDIGNLNNTPPNNRIVSMVPSANSVECLNILKKINPDVVVIVNTRILKKSTLDSIAGRFINIHAGITPKYRGWHGGYWALANKDRENCGVTIHLVDEGIDTGGVLYRGKIKITSKDNYYTYPFVQLVTGLPLLKKAVDDVLNGNLTVQKSETDSKGKLYYHPTICEYISNRMHKKVK